MQRSSFFNAVISKEGVPDRSYLAEDFARYFATFIGNGVFPNPANQLQVVAIDNNMNIRLKKGFAWINGYMYENTDIYTLTLDPADGVLDRIDRVVLRLDFLKRTIEAVVKKGDLSSSAKAKDLQRDSDAYEIALADIKVSKGAISITQQDITDLRLNKSLCGIVHGTVDQVDTTAIFNQFQDWYSTTKDNYDKDIATWTKEKKQAFEKWYSKNTKEFLNQFQSWYTEKTKSWEQDWTGWFKNTSAWEQNFNNWFNTIKKALDGDTAGNLLNLINKNTDKINSIEKNVQTTLEENNKKINKKIEQVTTQYEEFKKQKGKANGVASLGKDGKVPNTQLPNLKHEWTKIQEIILTNETTNEIIFENIQKYDELFVYIRAKTSKDSMNADSKIIINFNNNGFIENNNLYGDEWITTNSGVLYTDWILNNKITNGTPCFAKIKLNISQNTNEIKKIIFKQVGCRYFEKSDLTKKNSVFYKNTDCINKISLKISNYKFGNDSKFILYGK